MALCVTRFALIHAQMVPATKILGDATQESVVCFCIMYKYNALFECNGMYQKLGIIIFTWVYNSYSKYVMEHYSPFYVPKTAKVIRRPTLD